MYKCHECLGLHKGFALGLVWGCGFRMRIRKGMAMGTGMVVGTICYGDALVTLQAPAHGGNHFFYGDVLVACEMRIGVGTGMGMEEFARAFCESIS